MSGGSERTSDIPLPSTALKRSSHHFLFSDLHRITVPRLYSTQHIHPRSHRLWSVLPAHDVLASRVAVSQGDTMQHLEYRLRKIPLPRTPVNMALGEAIMLSRTKEEALGERARTCGRQGGAGDGR